MSGASESVAWGTVGAGCGAGHPGASADASPAIHSGPQVKTWIHPNRTVTNGQRGTCDKHLISSGGGPTGPGGPQHTEPGQECTLPAPRLPSLPHPGLT